MSDLYDNNQNNQSNNPIDITNNDPTGNVNAEVQNIASSANPEYNANGSTGTHLPNAESYAYTRSNTVNTSSDMDSDVASASHAENNDAASSDTAKASYEAPSTGYMPNNNRNNEGQAPSSTYSYTRNTMPGGSQPYSAGTGYTNPQNSTGNYSAGNTGFAGNTNSGNNPYNGGYNTYTHSNPGTQTSGNGYSNGGFNANNGQNGYYSNGYNNQPNHGFGFNQEPPRPVKKKKAPKSVTLTKGTAIILCISCVLLSLAAGILGAALVGGSRRTASILKSGDTENGAVATDENGDVVLYRSVKTEVESTESEDKTDVTAISNLVSDSVVEITTEFVTNSNSFFGQYISEGAGSGVIISTDGYIVTNNHVITDSDSGNYADSITVRLHNGTDLQARVIGSDSDADIAVIKVTSEDELTAAVWGDSDSIEIGQQIVVVGNPLGELGGTVTTGIISALDREVEISGVKMNLLQTDAAVNPGNSGGGMFNYKGELIGIVNAKSSGTGIEGLGFAIPANDAYDVVEQLIESGYVKGKAYLGLTFYEANSGYYSMTGDSSVLYVYSTEEGYNDDVLKRGDIVLTVDGEEVSTTADVKAILKQHKSGDELTFSIIRNKTSMEVKVKCYEYTPSEKNSVAFDN